MVHATTMILVMAEKDPPVFRDFLGIGRKDESGAKPSQRPSGFVKRNNTGFSEEGVTETLTRASSGNDGRLETLPAPGLLTPPLGVALPTSSDPGSEGWLRARAGALQHHGVKSAFYKPETDNRPVKKRDSPVGRESLQERLQMSVEALENRPVKMSRVDQKDDKRSKFRSVGPTTDELRLSMQPPRPSSKVFAALQTTVLKPDLSPRPSNKLDRPRMSPLDVGASTPSRLSHLGMSSDKSSAQLTTDNSFTRENIVLPPMLAAPAADEGSRTGIKGSGLLAGLQQSTPPSTQAPGVSNGPSPSPCRSKVSAHGNGSDSLLPSRHQFPTPPSRQLTIFYGGQAHVFDDVPPDKANQIMQLAGSNGRSWSTTYSPRQTTSIANSASEGSLSALERDREMNLNRSLGGGSVSGGNLALSNEVQTLLRGLAQSGRSSQVPPQSDAVALPSSTELKLAAAERAATNGVRKDCLERKAATRPTPCTEDSAKEALLRGQHWM